MSQDTIINIVQSALYTVIIVSAPPLLIGLSVGILVSIFQTVTSIQEPTLAFVPKIIAVFVAIALFGSFMLVTMREFVTNLFMSFPSLIIPR